MGATSGTRGGRAEPAGRREWPAGAKVGERSCRQGVMATLGGRTAADRAQRLVRWGRSLLAPDEPLVGVRRARVGLAASVRVTAHLAMYAQVVAGRRRRPFPGAIAASLIGDAVVVTRMRRSSYEPGTMELAVNAVDAGFWVLSTDPDDDTYLIGAILPAFPTAIAVGFWLVAGDRAEPTASPAQPFPPRTAAQRQQALVRLVGALAVPGLTTTAIQLARGQHPRRLVTFSAFPLVAVGFGAALARYRARQHRVAIEEWEQRARRAEAAEAQAATTYAASRSSPGHDFPKTLAALGAMGSAPARRAAQAGLSRPASLLGRRTDGATVRAVAGSLAIEPPEAGATWLPSASAEALASLLDRGVAEARAGDDPVVRIALRPGTGLYVRFLGAEGLVRTPAPRLRTALYPTSIGFLLSAWFAGSGPLLTDGPHQPAPALAAALAFDATGVARFWRRPPETAGDVRLLIALAAGHAVAALAPGRLGAVDHPGGQVTFPPSMGLTGPLAVVGMHWGRLSAAQRLAPLLLYGGWLAVILRWSRPHAGDLLAEAVSQSAALLATWRFTDMVDQESALLERRLAAQFEARCAAARHDALGAQLAHHRRQLALARSEAEEVAARADPEILAAVRAECDSLERWLRTADQADGSLFGRTWGGMAPAP